MKKIIFVLIIFFAYCPTFASNQSEDAALSTYFKQLQLGKIDSEKHLDSLIAIYPHDFRFSYQKAIVLIQSDKLKSATGILDSLVQIGTKNEMLYQLLINCYIQDNQVMKAVQVADSALAQFPNSPRILLESAYLNMQLNKTNLAISQLEEALNIDPYYFESYYPLIDYYANGGPYINWAILYSEMFINLSTKEKESIEISQQMFNLILNALPHDSVQTCSFTNIIYHYIPGQIDSSDYSFPIAYNVLMTHAYNTLIAKGYSANRSIKYIHSLLKAFNQSWNNSIYAKKWNNPVLEYHKLLIEKNLFEPYCYLILKEGSTEEFKSYLANNRKLFDKLLTFMEQNPIDLKPPFLSTKLQY